WLLSALLAYLAVKSVRGIERLWASLRSAARRNSRPVPSSLPSAPEVSPSANPARTPAVTTELVPDPSRRYFFRTASALAGAAPFLSVMYGFAAERLDYQVRRVDIPLANLPRS